jgi:hypothetical protein
MRLFGRDSTTNKPMPKRMVLGFAALASAAVVGAAGLVGATANKPTKAKCQAAGFVNYGQCVKAWAHGINNPGHGYGGDNNTANVKTDINVDANIDGDNNTTNFFITIVNNIFS